MLDRTIETTKKEVTINGDLIAHLTAEDIWWLLVEAVGLVEAATLVSNAAPENSVFNATEAA